LLTNRPQTSRNRIVSRHSAASWRCSSARRCISDFIGADRARFGFVHGSQVIALVSCRLYFQRIGASGFVLGRIRTAEAPRAPGLRLRYAAVMDGMREAIDKRIRAVLPGDKGAIASALITGKRDAISTPVTC
jgi:hypothetical protein